MSGKGFLGNMTENLQADCVQGRQAGFIQCFLCSVQEKRQAFVSACRLLFVSEATPHKARLQAGSYWNASTGSGAASMSERSMSKRNASSQSKKPALGK